MDFVSTYYGLFRETASVVAREQPDGVVMGAMAKGTLSSRRGLLHPVRAVFLQMVEGVETVPGEVVPVEVEVHQAN